MSSQPPWETQVQPGWGAQPPPSEQPQQPVPPQQGGWNQGAYAPPQPPPPPVPAPAPAQYQPPYPQFPQQPSPPQFTPPQMPGMVFVGDEPPPRNNAGRVVVMALAVVVLLAAAGGIFLYTKSGKGTDTAQPGTTKGATASVATTAPSTAANSASGSPSSSPSFPDNSYSTGPAVPPASPSAGSGGARLDSAATDKTPFTADALVSKTFNDDKNVAYTLKFAQPGPCRSVGDATVQKIVMSAPCGQLMAASWIDPDNSRIVVSAMVIPYPDAATATAVYKKLAATHTGDYSQWCPPAGQPGGDTCTKLAKAGTVTREGKFGAFHRYLLITTAVFVDLRNDDSQKDWLTAAAHGAFQNTLPGQ